MPVDETIRAGLAREAVAILPDAGRSLDAVRSRRRRRRLAQRGLALVAATLVVSLALLVLGRSPGAVPGPVDPPPAPSRIDPDSAEGVWVKEISVAEAKAAGVSETRLSSEWGSQRALTVRMFIGELGYQQSADYANGPGIGDRGSVEYDAQGRLVLTSTSTGCNGCTFRLVFERDGDTLELEPVAGQDLSPLERLHLSGTWRAG